VIVLLLGLAGGAGAVSRFVIDGTIRSKFRTVLPWATISINISGSFLLGLLAGFVLGGALPAEAQTIAGTGFLGGYTTFSTANVETVRLIQDRRPGMALINALGTLAATVPAATAGLALAGVL
jgi:CrcB protein